jgi:hypothetical protein
MTAHLIQDQHRYQSIAAAFEALEQMGEGNLGASLERLQIVKQEAIHSSELNPLAGLVEALAVGLAAQQERIDRLEAQVGGAAKASGAAKP